MSNSRRLIKNTIVLLTGNIGTKLIMIFLVPLYAHWLSISDYGIYDTMISLTSLIIPVISLQLEQSIFRGFIDNKPAIYIYISNAVNIISINSAIIVVSLIILKPPIYICYYCVYVIINSVFNIFMEALRGRNKLFFYSISNFLTALLTLILDILMVKVLGFGIKGMMLALVFTYSIMLLSLMIYQREILTFRLINLDALREQLRYSVPLIPNAVAFWIINLSDRVMILFYNGSAESGIYAVSSKFPALITLAYSAFTLAWQQEAISLYSHNNLEEIKKYYNEIVNILFSSLVLFLPFLKIITEIFFSEEYFNSIYLAPILLLATVFLCLAQFLSGILLAERNTKSIGVTTIIAAIANVVINLACLRYSVIYAAISTLVAYVILYALRAKCLTSLISEYKDIAKLLMYSGISILISILMIISNRIFGRVLCIFGVFQFCLINRKIIYGMWRKISKSRKL